ncbi:MAG: helix-turn-helix domain-containing protein [Clostridia bacterium]|nr:helix-turn-helix domain-containing protein [Clostridia bacterium]MDE7215445.1 helix-turn-helix domain-containing protein [Clostridia bacterium]
MLAEAIKNCGLTQTELASQLGVSQQTISSYIHKNKLPALETFANICSVLDLDANDVLCVNE